MFITFEGIDGAGKSTVSRLVHDLLSKANLDALYFPKSSLQGFDGFQLKQMDKLRELIWPDDDGSEHYKMGDVYWLYLVAAWYHVVSREQVLPLLSSNRVLIFDSWHYRFMTKFTSRGFPRQSISALFAGLPVPDLVVWLDTAPEVAWERRKFKESEMGRWSEDFSPGQESYLGYQAGIRGELGRMATAENWMTVRLGPHLTATEVAQMVVDEVLRRVNANIR